MIQEHWDKPENLQEKANKIANDAAALAEIIRVRDEVAEMVRGANEVTFKPRGWKIGNIQSANYHENECAHVLGKLREILRVPEGENIVTYAKVVRTLADGLISLQK